jgi:putative endonuclease
MYYVYVLQSKKDNKLYTGATNDLRKRLERHNRAQSAYTKHRGPFELIYYEVCNNKHDMSTREKRLKSGYGKRYIKERLKRFLSQT